MKKAAIQKARKRLSEARSHLKRVANADNYLEFESAWTQLLTTANSIDTILEFGAKSDKKSKPWYGSKINLRRSDPLLSYMHQARNSDEHGIEPVTEYDPGFVGIGGPNQDIYIESLVLMPSGPVGTVYGLDGRPPAITFKPAEFKLSNVVDERYGNEFVPPTTHLGKAIADQSPFGIGQLWLDYFEALVLEAAERACSS